VSCQHDESGGDPGDGKKSKGSSIHVKMVGEKETRVKKSELAPV
jgi:hypothetical protein